VSVYKKVCNNIKLTKLKEIYCTKWKKKIVYSNPFSTEKILWKGRCKGRKASF